MSFDTVNPPFTASDPSATYLASSCLDFLLIELVPLSYRIAAEVAAKEEEWMRGGPVSAVSAANAIGGALGAGLGVSGVGTGGASVSGTGKVESLAAEEDEVREAVFYRLEGLGYRVGLGVVERYVDWFFCCSENRRIKAVRKRSSSPSGAYSAEEGKRTILRPCWSSPSSVFAMRLQYARLTALSPQILSGQASLHGNTRRDQISLQRPLDARLPETDRQLEDQSQGTFSGCPTLLLRIANINALL